MKDTFVVRQELTWKELFSITFLYILRRKAFRRFFIFITALSLLSGFLGYVTGPEKLNMSYVLTFILPLAGMIAGIFLITLLVSLYIYYGKPWLFKNVSYEFTHWGITRIGEKTEFQKPWRDIDAIRESSYSFTIIVGGIDQHTIQKRMFADATELKAFRDFINERLNSN